MSFLPLSLPLALEQRCLLYGADEPDSSLLTNWQDWKPWLEDWGHQYVDIVSQHVDDTFELSELATFLGKAAQDENPLSYAIPVSAAALAGTGALWLAKQSLFQGGGYRVAFLYFSIAVHTLAEENAANALMNLAGIAGVHGLNAYAETLAQTNIAQQSIQTLGQASKSLGEIQAQLSAINLSESGIQQLFEYGQKNIGSIIYAGLVATKMILGNESEETSSSSSSADHAQFDPGLFHSEIITKNQQAIGDVQNQIGEVRKTIDQQAQTLGNSKQPASFFYQFVQAKLPAKSMIQATFSGVARILDTGLWLTSAYLHLTTVKQAIAYTYNWAEKINHRLNP